MSEKNNVCHIIFGQGQDWCLYSWKSVVDGKRIIFYNNIKDIIGYSFLGRLCQKHFSFWRRHYDHLPLRSIWYRLIFRALKMDIGTNYRLLFYDWGSLSRDLSFIKYIKKRRPDINLIYLFSNVVKISGAEKYGILNDLPNCFDRVFAFDKEDASRYGFDYSPLIYTRAQDYRDREILYDVFYIGTAKDRLDTLHSIYSMCVNNGLRCCFYIVGVSAEKQLYTDIHYNQVLPYKEVLDLISHSKCMVDVIQGGSTAMTIKVCEAVIYNKKLITTNKNVMNEPFYSSDRFLLYPSSDNLVTFVDSEMIQFSEGDKAIFSPASLIDKMNKCLSFSQNDLESIN